MKEISLPTKARLTSDLVPDLALTHGKAVWVLAALGFSTSVTDQTFNHYIKSLRKIGVPFARGNTGVGSGRLAKYSYNHLMELSIALRLRVYGTLPDPVIHGIIRFRRELYGLYRRAYLEHASGLGAPADITATGRSGFRMSGVYLDLKLCYAGGRFVSLGPPRALSPFEALRAFANSDEQARAHLPFNLSHLAIHVVQCAEQVPDIRRGPH